MLLVRLQQISGILIVLLIQLDVFLTVLYARMGSGLISPQLARTFWRVFRVVARSFPRHCDRIASFCGPVILVLLVLVWMAGLTLGNDDGLRQLRELLLLTYGFEVTSTTSKTPLSVMQVRSFPFALICRSVSSERAMALADVLRR